MPRARSPNRDKAFDIFKEHKGDIPNRTIADMLGISEKTVGGWKCKDRWSDKLNGVLQTSERSTPKKNNPQKSTNPKEKLKKGCGSPAPGSKFAKRNQAARIHGLRAKYFTDSQREIMEDFQDLEVIDQLWIQIEIKFSAIIQLQKVMWVETADDHLQEESGNHSGDGGSGEQFKVAFAFERYESYIKAQTRAMAEYRNLVKRFLEMSGKDDERRLKLEGMQLDNVLKHEKLNVLRKSDDETNTKLTEYLDKLEGAFK